MRKLFGRMLKLFQHRCVMDEKCLLVGGDVFKPEISDFQALQIFSYAYFVLFGCYRNRESGEVFIDSVKFRKIYHVF